MSQVIEIKDLVLYELKCFRKEIKNEVKKLEENLVCMLSSLQNKRLQDISEESKCPVQTLESQTSNSPVATGSFLYAAEVIDLTDYFDDLEVPQINSVSSSHYSDETLRAKVSNLHSAINNKNENQFNDKNNVYVDSKSLVHKFVNDDDSDAVDVTTTNDNQINSINATNSPTHKSVLGSHIKNKTLLDCDDETDIVTHNQPSASNVQAQSDDGIKQIGAIVDEITTFTDAVTGQKLRRCPYCNKNFKYLKDAKRHLHIHTGERPFICIFCNKGFKRASHMRSHMRTHTGERPYKCDKCPKTFCSSGSLSNHKHVHDETYKNSNPDFEKEIRPYICIVCDRRFKQKVQRDGHMNCAHLGVKKFNCEVCDRKFARKEHVERHMRCHTGEKPYKCPFCDCTFADCSTLRKHKISLHDY